MKWYWKPLMTIGLFLAYLKTSEAMVQFAPRMFLGISDPMVPILWGYISAALVEGLALMAFDKLLTHTKDTPTRTASALVVGAAVLFSIAMNIIDQKITDHSLGTMETGIGAFLYGMMGLLPIITGTLIGSLLLVDAYYPDHKNQGGGGNKGSGNQGSNNQMRQFEQYQDVTERSQYGGGPALQAPPMRAQIPQVQSNGNGHGNENDKLNLLRGMQNKGGGRTFPNDLEPAPRLVDIKHPQTPQP